MYYIFWVLMWKQCLCCFFLDLTEGSPGFQLARHNLSYIQEIGNGWFGQVSVHVCVCSVPQIGINFHSPLVTCGPLPSVYIPTGYSERTLHRFRRDQSSGEGVKSERQLQGAE